MVVIWGAVRVELCQIFELLMRNAKIPPSISNKIVSAESGLVEVECYFYDTEVLRTLACRN